LTKEKAHLFIFTPDRNKCLGRNMQGWKPKKETYYTKFLERFLLIVQLKEIFLVTLYIQRYNNRVQTIVIKHLFWNSESHSEMENKYISEEVPKASSTRKKRRRGKIFLVIYYLFFWFLNKYAKKLIDSEPQW